MQDNSLKATKPIHTGPRLGPFRRSRIGLLRFLAVIITVATIDLSSSAEGADATPPQPGTDTAPVTVTILATNAADIAPALDTASPTQGEWSFSAWIEVGDRVFLFDTGWSPRNVLDNAEALGIDLSVAKDLILSHHHRDHTGGIETLRNELSKRNPEALSRIHVAKGFFVSRPGPDGSERNPMLAARQAIEASGATFIVYEQATEIAPQVWLTGPVPRQHDERNYPQGPRWVMQQDGQTVPDIIPESQSLVIVAAEGPILISGCGHAGLVNTLDYVQSKVSDQSPQAAIGGFHLFAASDEVLRWTGAAVAQRQLGHFVGSHCTGFESVYQIREHAHMDRAHALVGAIGTRYGTGRGIMPGNINR